MSQITVIVRKAVDRYHKVGIAIDVEDDTYHRGLVKLGALIVVEEAKPEPEQKPKAKAKRKPGAKTGRAKS